MHRFEIAHRSNSIVSAITEQSVFLINFVAALGSCVGAVYAFVAWNYHTNLIIEPIEDVILISQLIKYPKDATVHPISRIGTEEIRVPTLWGGYEIGIVEFCDKITGGYSEGVPDAFEKGPWKILLPGDQRFESLVANTNLTDATCKRVEKNKIQYRDVRVVFDDKIKGITDNSTPWLFLSGARKRGATGGQERLDGYFGGGLPLNQSQQTTPGTYSPNDIRRPDRDRDENPPSAYNPP